MTQNLITNENIEVVPVEEEEEIDTYPIEEDYIIVDLRSDKFYYAFNPNGAYHRPCEFILINCQSTH